jgi:hypothetical protein
MKGLVKLLMLMSCFMVQAVYAGERHYEEAGNFSYEIPDGWMAREWGGLKYKVLYTTSVNGFAPNITFIEDKYHGNLKQYVESNIPGMEKGVPGFKVLRQAKGKTEQGRPYHVLRYRHKSDIGTLKQTVFVLATGGERKLLVTCTPAIGTEARIDKVCRQVVNSLLIEQAGQ